MNTLHELRDHYRVYCTCETDAVRGLAARPFVHDAQSAMRLPESRSRRSPDLLSGSPMALCASRTNGLAADRRSASRFRNCDKHDSDHLRMQCIRSRALKCLEATPTPRPFWFLQRRQTASGLASLPAVHVAK